MEPNTYRLENDVFIRSIKQNKNVSHVVLLGAGASVSSQIQPASDYIWEWKHDIYSSNQIARIGNLLTRFEGKTYDYRFFI